MRYGLRSVPETGELIGPYRVIAPLGKGAMGEVWRARDERLDRYVALKVLPADVAGDVERRARMLREARAAAALRHANVVTLFDVVAYHGDDILVMELVDGKTLAETLRAQGRPPLDRALAWIESLADAFAAAHARGILHRDIKAANVMIDSGGGVKVLDFGLAKLRDDHAEIAAVAAANTEPTAPTAVPQVPQVRERPQPTEVSATDSTQMPAAALGELASYRTLAGQLIGTPLYMAPEQFGGGAPDERSEVYSLGVLAHEIVSGAPPYSAATVAELFAQVASQPPKPLVDVPGPIAAVIGRAMTRTIGDRYPTMAAFRDAIAAQRRVRAAPRARKWPLAVGAIVVAAIAAATAWWLLARGGGRAEPGDQYVDRALEEYDVFYSDKAMSSLRAAIAVAPEHPRANAYMLLFGNANESDRAAALAALQKARTATDDGSKDRALVDAAIAFAEQGPAAARQALLAAGAPGDRESAFWTAELDYRAGRYDAAAREYAALLADPAESFRGRIYDHYSAVLLYFDRPDEALKIGTLYRNAFPGEPDAVGVYATTLATAGQSRAAIGAAEDALRLSEGEDTLAGLAKVAAMTGDRARAIALYRRALDRAGPARRPVRRAALGFLQWIDGDVAGARATVAPCSAGGADGDARERGACLFVAGLVDPARADAVAHELDGLAADATPLHPAYGAPASLAALVRARTHFFGGGCVVDPSLPARAQLGDAPPAPVPPAQVDAAAYATPLDFYAAYHLPFFFSWATCEHAALLAARGDRAGAAALLEPLANRAPGRTWLAAALARYE